MRLAESTRSLIEINFLTLKPAFGCQPALKGSTLTLFSPSLIAILSGFPLNFCLFCSLSDGKSCFSIRKSILTNKQGAEHPFAGHNTQHLRLELFAK